MNSEEQQFLNTLDKKLWTARSSLDAVLKDSDNDYFLSDDAHDLIHQELEIRYYYTEKNVFWDTQWLTGKIFKTTPKSCVKPIGISAK